MKIQYKLLYLCILVMFSMPMFCPLGMQADDELMPVLTKGKKWICRRQSSFDYECTWDTLTVVKDTLMWDMNVKCVLDIYRPGRYMFWQYEDEAELESQMFYLTENNGRIERIETRWEKDENGRDSLCFEKTIPLMDMNMHKGDSALYFVYSECDNPPCFHFYSYLTIDDEWKLEIRDVMRKVLYKRMGAWDEIDFWIEGIGFVYSWNNMVDDMFPTSGQAGYILMECYYGDRLIYTYGDVLASFAAGVSSIPADSTRVSTDGVIYDLNGRIVQRPIRGGVYIINGRKVRWTE